jgi:hypothetical protein
LQLERERQREVEHGVVPATIYKIQTQIKKSTKKIKKRIK